MQQPPHISAQDKKDLEKFSKFLCIKSSQVIVQGRLGKPVSSQCSPLPTGAEWFNLAIKDYPEIQKEAKYALLDGNPTIDSSFVVEISLRTSDSESLTLEVWSLSVTGKCEDVRVHHTVYNRMSLLLKSLMCVSRATPAYKLSRTQGSEYVICFRVYTGKVDISGLGEGFKTLRVGSIGTPTGTLILSAAFRTAENLHVSTKKLTPGAGGPIQVSPDHFTSPKNATMSPARPCCTLKSRLMSRGELESSSQSPCGPVESPSYGTLPTSFCTSPSEMNYLETSRNRQMTEQGIVFTVGSSSINRDSRRGSVPHIHQRLNANANSIRSLVGTGQENEPILNSGIRSKTISRSNRDVLLHYQGSHENVIELPSNRNLKERQDKDGLHQCTVSPATTDLADICRPVEILSQTSLTSTLTSEQNAFKPIKDFASHERTCFSADNNIHHSNSDNRYQSVPRGIKPNNASLDSITTLKSNSPTSAKVGFPENNETTSHMTHVPPSRAPSTANARHKAPPQQLMPNPGAFVSNSKTAARAYNTLSGISDEKKLPFEELIVELKTDEICNKKQNSKSGNHGSSSSDTSPESGREDASTITRLSSQSSLSSHHSEECSPPQGHHFPQLKEPDDDFVMVDLNPAFGKSDSAADLGTFYRECENAPDLLMFQENNGTETQEALLDLTKQLEDYERDAADFDNFVEELQSTLP